MDSPESLHAALEDMMNRMVLAGWLKAYRWTEGKGWHLVWSELGARKSRLLKMIIEAHSLLDDDRAAMAYDVVAKGGSFEGLRWSGLDPELQRFWLECLEDFGDRPEGEDELLAYVHVIHGWAFGE